jgi:hypothetical protein
MRSHKILSDTMRRMIETAEHEHRTSMTLISGEATPT